MGPTRLDWPLHGFWRYRLVGLVHTLTALNRNGHTGTCHEQSHDGEQRGARCAGQRQLGDGLHVLHGLAAGVDQAPQIGSGVPRQNSYTFFEGHGEARLDVKIDVASTLSFRDGVQRRDTP